MKEATGELNMTLITVVAIAAIAAIFYLWVWPSIQVAIARNTCEASCGENNSGCAEINRTMVQTKDFDASAQCNYNK